jgi:hypothetical protein
MLKKNEDDGVLIDKLIFSMNKGSSGQPQATKNELLDTIRLCASGDTIRHIVLDGIDECDNGRELLLDLCNALEPASVKVIMFSRPHVFIPKIIRGAIRLDIGKSLSEDINTYLSRRLDVMVEEDLLPPSVETEQLVERLTSGADGMFLWAFLMVNYLCSPSLTRTRRLTEIQKIRSPEGLDVMYERILRHLSLRSRSDQDFASWVFMWLTFSCRHMMSTELEATFMLRSSNMDDNDSDFSDFNATLLATCGSLVEQGTVYHPRSLTNVPGYRFIHLSVYEFFAARLESQGFAFLLSGPESHLTIARVALQYIALNIPHSVDEREKSPTLDKESAYYLTLDSAFPFLDYAMTYWIRHLRLHSNREGTADQIAEGANTSTNTVKHDARKHQSIELSGKTFLELLRFINSFYGQRSALMQYVDLSYYFHTAELDTLPEWLKWASLTCSSDTTGDVPTELISKAEELARYLLLLHNQWGSKLKHQPWMVWDEVPAFTPSHLIHEPAGIQVHSLWTNNTDPEIQSSTHLCKVSATSRDLEHIGILSIWPSK